MSNPTTVDLYKNQIKKIATDTPSLTVNRISKTPSAYFWTYRKTGETAPTDTGEFVPMFSQSPDVQFIKSEDGNLDIYAYCKRNSGKIRVDNLVGGSSDIRGAYSVSGNSLVASTPESNYIFAGKAHNASITIENISVTGLYYCVLDLSALSSDKIAVVEPVEFFANNGPIKVRTYDCTEYVGGTTYDILDANEIENDTSEAVFKYNVTSVTGATKIRNYVIGSSGNRISSRGGFSGSINPLPFGNTIKVVEVDSNYLSGTIDFNIQILWYEVGA